MNKVEKVNANSIRVYNLLHCYYESRIHYYSINCFYLKGKIHKELQFHSNFEPTLIQRPHVNLHVISI